MYYFIAAFIVAITACNVASVVYLCGGGAAVAAAV
jgi:hypothetical protein